MTARSDAGLALVVLAAFVAATRRVDASLSGRALLAGAAGTLAFEAVAVRRRERVRSLWARPPVRAGGTVCGLAVAAAGWRFAARTVLSAGIGALVSYLLLLVATRLR